MRYLLENSLTITAILILNICIYPDDSGKITVTGSRSGSADSTGSSSSVNSSDVEEKQSVTAGDALKELSGVFVSGDGRTGQSQYLFVRGFRSSDVLVIIDGVEITDPLSPNGAADLSFSPENIAKIELMKGPQSVLYGNGALSGVLEITTKKGHGAPRLKSSFSTGVLDMSLDRYVPDIFSSSLSLSGGNGNFFYNGGGSFFYTKGISMADSYNGIKSGLYDTVPENDRVVKGDIHLRSGLKMDDNNEWEFFFKAGKGEKDIDDGPGMGADDPNRVLDSEDMVFRSVVNSSFFGDIWNMETAFGIRLNSLKDSDNHDPGKVTGDMKSSYESASALIKWENFIKAARWYSITAGFELKRDWGEAQYTDLSSGRTIDLSFEPSPDLSLGIYAFNIFRPVKKLDITAGFRLAGSFYQIRLADKVTDELLDPQSREIIEPLFSCGISYEAPSETVFKARVARGMSAPTLFQRFSSFADIYNELKPEIAWGFDGVIQQYLFEKKIKLEAGYFYELKENHIDLDKSGKFSNRYRIENHGLEIALQTKDIYGFSLNASYTWIFKMNEFRIASVDGRKYKESTDVLRRPAHTFNTVLNYELKKVFNVCLSLNYAGERLDEVYNYPKTPYVVTADDFILLDIALSYKINRYLTVFAKIENMLDNDDYAYSVEYGTAGITPWIGIKLDTGG